MLVLEAAMGSIVAIYYCWPAGKDVLSRYAAWQHGGGVLLAAFATALAGGVLSELSLVYLQDKGRWSAGHLEHMGFKFVLFFINGTFVYEFYAYQTIWFGEGTAWTVLLPKIVADQFGYSVFWAAPFQTLIIRWRVLGYSASRLRRELGATFLIEHILPVVVTSWMFWIPGVTLIYSMPSNLQAPLFIFATAIWGLLLPALLRQETPAAVEEEVVLA